MSIAVLGLGNVLMGDDGLGPFVARTLEAGWEFPPGVSVLDAGTPGFDLIPFISGADAVIFIDTVRSAGDPGELRLYRRDEILRHPPQPRVTPHDPALKESLLTLEFAGGGPREVLLVGVIPGPQRKEPGLCPPVRAAVDHAVQEVLAELARLGQPATPRSTPTAPDIWWERS